MNVTPKLRIGFVFASEVEYYIEMLEPIKAFVNGKLKFATTEKWVNHPCVYDDNGHLIWGDGSKSFKTMDEAKISLNCLENYYLSINNH